MFCTVSQKAKAMMALLAISAGLVVCLPEAALSQHTTLRNPLLPSASTAAPGSVAATGQAPPIGHGASPLPVAPGDVGGLQPPPSSFADPTHGNIFPIRGGAPTDFPAPYAPGAGRHQTAAGQQDGLFDWGQGNGGTGMGPGGPNGGSGWINNGGSAPGASGMGPGGTNGGSFWGPGGPNGGTGMFDNGGAAGGASGRGPGGPNGGTFWGPGGSNGGTGLTNNGGPAGGASGMGPGGSNGGTGVFEGGAGSTGTGVMDGGGSTGVGVVNNGGNAGGTGIVNNGGPTPGAIGTPENPRAITPHSARYDFNGVLPTVRTFSRYLVILGVTAGTIFMALAAWSMVMGSPYGGSRVLGAAGGLILLLMGYTIWKIVQMNTFNGNSTGWESRYQNGAPQVINGPNGNPANPGGAGGGPPAGPAPGPGPGPGPGGPIGGPGNPGGP